MSTILKEVHTQATMTHATHPAILPIPRLRYVALTLGYRETETTPAHTEEVVVRVPASSSVKYQVAPWLADGYNLIAQEEVSRDVFLKFIRENSPAVGEPAEF